jgi:K+ channel tetramerisation domain.
LFHRDDDILYVAESESFIPIGSSVRSVPCINTQPQSPVTTSDDCATLCSKLNSEWVTLNVGGKYFTTSRSTLMTKEPMSMLARLVKHQIFVLLMKLGY